MFKAIDHPYLVPFNQSFKIANTPTGPGGTALGKKEGKKLLKKQVEALKDLQRALYAHDKFSLLLVFQAMDAAGKDSTIRAVMSGVNPAGFQVYSFKKPSAEELDHDFLWRTTCSLPERGRIGIFNRSYYEETLVVRVHPDYLNYQRLPYPVDLQTIWQERFESINDFEKHIARNGTIVLKFWLNVSREEQKNRFLDRLNVPEKNWKFSSGDVAERQLWDKYMTAYQETLNATSTPYAPWYAIPADDKPYMRLTVASIIVKTLESLNLSYPTVSEEDRAEFDEMRRLLDSED